MIISFQMKLSRVYCQTCLGNAEIFVHFQKTNQDLFDSYNPQFNHMMRLLHKFGISPSELFRSYEDGMPIPLRGDTKCLSSNDILRAFAILMQRMCISRSELARRMGVEKTYLSSLFNQRYSTDLRMNTIKRMSDSLGIKLSLLFQVAEDSHHRKEKRISTG